MRQNYPKGVLHMIEQTEPGIQNFEELEDESSNPTAAEIDAGVKQWMAENGFSEEIPSITGQPAHLATKVMPIQEPSPEEIAASVKQWMEVKGLTEINSNPLPPIDEEIDIEEDETRLTPEEIDTGVINWLEETGIKPRYQHIEGGEEDDDEDESINPTPGQIAESTERWLQENGIAERTIRKTPVEHNEIDEDSDPKPEDVNKSIDNWMMEREFELSIPQPKPVIEDENETSDATPEVAPQKTSPTIEELTALMNSFRLGVIKDLIKALLSQKMPRFIVDAEKLDKINGQLPTDSKITIFATADEIESTLEQNAKGEITPQQAISQIFEIAN